MDTTRDPRSREHGRIYNSSCARARVLSTLDELTARGGRPPTQREWFAAAGLSSMGHLHWYLSALVEAGEIENRGGSRGYIRVRKPEGHAT